MSPSMLPHYRSSFLTHTPDPVSSAALQIPSPFIASTHAPNNLYLSRSRRWPGAQDPSFVQSSPISTSTLASISVRQEVQAPGPFQAVDPSLSRPTNDYQSHASFSPHSQHPPSLCNDSFGRGLKEKRRPRPSNAFILFRSDLLKRKTIFKGLETRQNKLSVIAAKCWDKLTREEKKKWFLEAEREKKEHAVKYADYRIQTQTLSRGTRVRTRKIMASPPRDWEQERLGRLADMAYKEIINDIRSQPERESTMSPSPCTTAVLTSGTPTPPPRAQWNGVFTLGCYLEQGQPSPQAPVALSSPAGEEGHHSLTMSSARDFGPFEESRLFPTTEFVDTPYPTTIAHPMRPTAGNFSRTTAQQTTTFPSELML